MKYDSLYMGIAHLAASQSHATRAKVGVVAVKGDRVLEMGFNGTPSGYHTNKCELDDGTTMQNKT